ncbi:hypothetical protein V1506DRAFT_237738, partial [Lipomyces tetrasporus]
MDNLDFNLLVVGEFVDDVQRFFHRIYANEAAHGKHIKMLTRQSRQDGRVLGYDIYCANNGHYRSTRRQAHHVGFRGPTGLMRVKERTTHKVGCTFHIKLTTFREATRIVEVDLRHPTHGDDYMRGGSYHAQRKLTEEERQNVVRLHSLGFSQSNIATFLTAHREEANNFSPISYMDVANVLNPRDHPRRRIRDYLRLFDNSILTSWHSHAVDAVDPAANEGHDEQIDRLFIVERKYVREVRQRPH